MDIFWERQEGKLCRKHSLNAYFGCAKISTPKFIEYCTQYNEYIYEVTSSSLNQKTFNSLEKDEYTIGEVVTPNNFGFMQISNRNKTINIELANGFYKNRRVFKSLEINY